MRIRWSSFWFVMMLVGCSTPRISLRVSGNVSACYIDMRNPWMLRGKPVVQRIEVYRGSPPEGSAQCVLSAVDEGHALSQWRLGIAIPSYQLEQCTSLTPGERYTVDISAVSGFGSRPFGVALDGRIDDLGREWW